MTEPVPHQRPLSVCLLVGSLEFGGAERQVVEMMRSFDRDRVSPFVCSLSRKVPLAASLSPGAEELFIVEKKRRVDFAAIWRVAKLLRRRRVDVVHAFLFDAEMIARLAAFLARVPVVIASERNTDYARPLLHKLALKVTQPLFDVMVANSSAGKRFNMRTLRLPDSRIEVVHNGVDLDRFSPDRTAGLGFRERNGIPVHVPLIGMVGSYKRQKAQDCFIKMAAQVRRSVPDAWFMLVGEPVRNDFADTSLFRNEVRELARTLNVFDRCVFLDNQNDMKSVYNACDITALLSHREGTPNVVLESMACGVPVVATNVADNALIVIDGTTGGIVDRGDCAAAADRVIAWLRDPECLARLARAARDRACSQFSLRAAAGKLENIYFRARFPHTPAFALSESPSTRPSEC